MDNGTMVAVSKKYHQRRPIGAPHFLLAAILFFTTAMSTLSISCAIPVGIWGGLPYTEDGTELERLTDEYGMTIVVTTMEAGYAVNSFLPRMKANGWKAVIRFADNWTEDPDDDSCGGEGKFSLSAFKDSLVDRLYDTDEYRAEIQAYVDDGTLLAVLMADDVMNYGDFGWDDCDPKPFGINLMAKHLKDLWDGIQVWIRIDPTDLKERYDDPAFWPGGAGKIRPFNQYIDAVIAQYSRAVSTPAYSTRYATVQQSAADALGMDMVCGLNIADGGNGNSGQEGWRGPGFYTMTPTEVSWYGRNLIKNSECKYMLLWEFDGEEVWPDGTIGGEYFEADDDYKVSILKLEAA